MSLHDWEMHQEVTGKLRAHIMKHYHKTEGKHCKQGKVVSTWPLSNPTPMT